MKLDDIAKMAIDEVSAELETIEALDVKKPTFEIISNDDEQNLEKTSVQEKSIKNRDTQTQTKKIIDDDIIISSEEIFLTNLAERIEVLFEGLNETPKDSLENRLELTLKFLEFALANVENRLSNLKK